APALTARTTGDGNSGAIQIASVSLTATSTFFDPNGLPTTLIDSHTEGNGRGGDVSIVTGNLSVSGPLTTQFFFIDSGTRADGHGGDITITADNIHLDFTTIATGDFLSRNFGLQPSGSAGNLVMTAANSFQLSNSILDTGASAALGENQVAGDIT